ncbi:MAG: hypothetical protein ACR2IL_06345 [Chitinophagaceae bacterium]
MANKYQAALSRSGINTAGPQLYWQLRSNGSARLRLVEIGIAISVAPTTAPLFQISRATASLGTASTTLAGQPFDSSDAAATGIFESAWSVAPTINTTYHRMMGLPVTAGNGFIWSFPNDGEMVIGGAAVAHELQITNANASGATTGTFSGYVVWEE